MIHLSTTHLEKHHSTAGVTFRELAPYYPVIDVVNDFASATIAIHGGQVIAYQPVGQAPVLWTSKSAIYSEGKAIRGGIPICWPWFADHENSGLPAHGFARNRFWRLVSVKKNIEGKTYLVLGIKDSAATRAIWPNTFELELRIVIADSLSVCLLTTNTSPHAFAITEALHSYFSIADIKSTEVSVLDRTSYVDKLNNEQTHIQRDSVRFDKELDRIYHRKDSPICIHDLKNLREIVVERSGSHSAVIWNPWIEKSSKMTDFDENAYRNMVCVEAGNVGKYGVLLGPNETHTLETRIFLR